MSEPPRPIVVTGRTALRTLHRAAREARRAAAQTAPRAVLLEWARVAVALDRDETAGRAAVETLPDRDLRLTLRELRREHHASLALVPTISDAWP